MAKPLSPPVAPATVRWRWPALHPEGRRYVIGAAVIALIGWFIWSPLFWPLLLLTAGVAAFFRDPVRVTPRGDDLVLAPADGLVTMIVPCPPPPELAALGTASLVRVSILMSVFDVHVNRTPVAGTVAQIVYISGKFLNAELDKASEDNERQHVLVQARNGRLIGFTQIAGLLAQRIVTFVKPGDTIAAGQRVGMIRFGSRVDVWLPMDTACQVALGQHCVAGETVIGRVGAAVVSGIAQ